LGDWSGARAEFEAATDLLAEVGISWVSPYPLDSLGYLDLAEGRHEEGTRNLQESLALAESTVNLLMVSEVHVELAEYDLVEGRPEAARARLSALDTQISDRVERANSATQLAWAHIELGDLVAAETWLESAELISRRQEQRLERIELLRVRALWHAAQQQWDAADAAVTESRELAHAIPYPYAEAKALATHGTLLARRGAAEAAREGLTAALVILQRLGEHLWAAQVEQRLADLRGR
jgi:tetratricopeptide (TPR) repeat protein